MNPDPELGNRHGPDASCKEGLNKSRLAFQTSTESRTCPDSVLKNQAPEYWIPDRPATAHLAFESAQRILKLTFSLHDAKYGRGIGLSKSSLAQDVIRAILKSLSPAN